MKPPTLHTADDLSQNSPNHMGGGEAPAYQHPQPLPGRFADLLADSPVTPGHAVDSPSVIVADAVPKPIRHEPIPTIRHQEAGAVKKPSNRALAWLLTGVVSVAG